MRRKGKIFAIIMISSITLFGCDSDNDSGNMTESGNGDICKFGQDQSCNDDLAISSIHGICNSDSTCQCLDGFVLNTETGKCKVPDCIVGQDQSCNDDLAISSIHGTCNSDSICECLEGFELNIATGKCK